MIDPLVNDREDEFQPMGGPSLAAVHRQWLDRGLPSHTWLAWLKEYGEMRSGDLRPVTHAHRENQCCFPRCPRWGS